MKANTLVSLKKIMIILKPLDVSEDDNILIIDDKIYIENKNMAGQQKARRQETLVRDGKIFEEYQNIVSGNFKASNTSTDFSLLFDKTKNNSPGKEPLGCLQVFSNPLRQINGNIRNVIPKKVNIRGKHLVENKVKTSWFPDQPLSTYSRNAYLKRQGNDIPNAIFFKSVFTRSANQFSSCSPPTLSVHVPSVLSQKSKDFTNHVNQELRSNQTYNQWKKNAVSKMKYNETRKSNFRGTKFLQGRETTTEHKICKVAVERVDAKICFMHYLRLKPRVNIDVHKMYELSLLRIFNIRKCQVVLPRKIDRIKDTHNNMLLLKSK